MIKTGVFASAEDLVQIKQLYAEECNTPVVKVHGEWLPDLAHENLMRAIDAAAVRAGLPSPKTDDDGKVVHYGIKGDGEFVTADEVEEE